MQPIAHVETRSDWIDAVAFPTANLRSLVELAAVTAPDDDLAMRATHSPRTLVADSHLDRGGASSVEGAWRVLRATWPEMWSESQFLVRSVEVRTVDTNVLSSGTSGDKPYAVTLAVDLRMPAAVVAEALVHETAHLKLHLLERLVSIADASSVRYRHPWRDDLRPARGVLVACHAFAAVHRYWALSAESGVSDPTRALQEARRVSTEMENGLRTLNRVEELTPTGRRIASLINVEVAQTTRQLRQLETLECSSGEAHK